MKNPLLFASPNAWLDCVLNDFDSFLKDHAAAEKKAAGMAISMISHYPDKTELVEQMSELAVEEMSHFREVIKLIHQRGLQLAPDTKDAYVTRFRKVIRNGKEEYLMDRLLIGAIIEARGAERFGLIGEHIQTPELARFYRAIANSEGRHYEQFLNLAYLYLEKEAIDTRAAELLNIEAEICASLPVLPQLH